MDFCALPRRAPTFRISFPSYVGTRGFVTQPVPLMLSWSDEKKSVCTDNDPTFSHQLCFHNPVDYTCISNARCTLAIPQTSERSFHRAVTEYFWCRCKENNCLTYCIYRYSHLSFFAPTAYHPATRSSEEGEVEGKRERERESKIMKITYRPSICSCFHWKLEYGLHTRLLFNVDLCLRKSSTAHSPVPLQEKDWDGGHLSCLVFSRLLPWHGKPRAEFCMLRTHAH